MNSGLWSAITTAAALVGLGLIVRGLRGVPVLTAPLCRACGYDLRGFGLESPSQCPECGADLTPAEAVQFGRYEQRWIPIGIGMALLMLLTATWGAILFVSANRSGYVRANAPVVISPHSPVPQNPMLHYTIYGLSRQLEQKPFDIAVWDELRQRQQASALTPGDIRAVVDTFVKSAAGLGRLPPTGDAFVQAALAAKEIDSTAFGRFGRAAFGDRANVQLRPVLHRGFPAAFPFSYGTMYSPAGLDFVYALRQVMVDGGTAQAWGDSGPDRPDRISGRGSQGLGYLKVDAPPGKHTLIFLFDAALLPAGKLPTSDLPGQAAQWPTPLARWVVAMPIEVEVSERPYSDIELVTDPSLDPLTTLRNRRPALALQQVSVEGSSYDSVIRVAVILGFLPLDQSYNVTVTAAGKTFNCGHISMLAEHDAACSSDGDARGLPFGTQTCTVTLTPNLEPLKIPASPAYDSRGL